VGLSLSYTSNKEKSLSTYKVTIEGISIDLSKLLLLLLLLESLRLDSSL
jgi:hypothetical protein